MDEPVPLEQHPHGADLRVFLKQVETQIHDKIKEEIKALNGNQFMLTPKVNYRRTTQMAVRSTQSLKCEETLCLKLSQGSKKRLRSGQNREGLAGLSIR